MGTPASATPDSSTWSGLTSHSTPLHGPLHSSPLVHNAMLSPGPSSKNHSTPQRQCFATPKLGRGGLTPAKHFDSKLLSSVRSPYQKSYTPLSATPSGHSPAFKTPIRMMNNSPHPVKTPLGTKLPHSARKMVTPQSGVINPFEDALFSKYHESVLSPGLFAYSETPSEKKASRSFRWSIDQLAILHPADIDENTCQESHRSRFDREVEETAQRAISNFFEANNIVASPWPDSNGRPVFVATPKSPSSGLESCDGEKARPKKTQDASCQTTLTLPMGFNLEKILGEFMTYTGQEEDTNQQESLSNSSLRRKLFFHGEASPMHSPVKKAEESLSMHCDEATESFKPLPTQSHSDKFSSSPITLSKGEHFVRVSDEMDGICSPKLSPIGLNSTGVKKGGGSFMSKSHRRSASLRQQNAMASPELSPIVPGGKVRSRLSLDVSPICSPQKEGADVFSPIQQQSEPLLSIRHCENTPVTAQLINGLSPALSTPSTVGTSKASEGSVHVTMATLVTTPGFSNADTINSGTPVTDAPPPPNNQSDKPLPFSGLAFQEPRLLMSDISMDVTGMETEYAVNSTELPNPDSVPDHRNFGFPVSRDCSMLYEETTNPSCISSNIPTSHSQDTGYQTGSLQLTNQDTGLLQTNLTNQFSSLPFKSYSEPDGMDEGVEMEQNLAERALPRPVILKEKLEVLNTSVVSRQLNYHTSLPSTKAAFTKEKVLPPKVSDYLKTEVEGCSLIHEGLTEDEVIAKARFILGQNISVSSAVPSRSTEPVESSTHSMSWQPTCSSTPQKTQLGAAGLQSPVKGQLPSELAMKILRRAERDLEELSTIPSSTAIS